MAMHCEILIADRPGVCSVGGRVGNDLPCMKYQLFQRLVKLRRPECLVGVPTMEGPIPGLGSAPPRFIRPGEPALVAARSDWLQEVKRQHDADAFMADIVAKRPVRYLDRADSLDETSSARRTCTHRSGSQGLALSGSRRTTPLKDLRGPRRRNRRSLQLAWRHQLDRFLRKVAIADPVASFGRAKRKACVTCYQANIKGHDFVFTGFAYWPAAGSVDTEIGCFREPEASDAEAQVQSRVQDRGGPLGA